MKKKTKGFTLIELLVVVAIIGILAAVGVVAYNGYTEGAKKSAAKSNQASLVKYVAAELQKCNIGEDFVMKKDLSAASTATNSLKCSNRKSAGTVHARAKSALEKEFKNPYNTSATAIINTDLTACAATSEGQTSIVDNGSIVNIKTCINDVTADLITNAVQIE